MIVDTSILVAAADRKDVAHAGARAVLERPDEKIVCEPVVAETDYFLLRRFGVDVELAFLEAVDSAFVVEPSTRGDRDRARELCVQYRDAQIGFTDALIIAIAERLGERVIATLDRRPFAMVRPKHVEAFEVIP